MPFIHIRTNTKHTPNDCLPISRKISRLVAEITDKSEQKVMAMVEAGHSICFGGSSEPAAYLQVKCLSLDVSRNVEYTRCLCQVMAESMGIPADRCYIEFCKPERHMWGWNNRTFG